MIFGNKPKRRTRSVRRRAFLGAALTAIAALVAGCGGGGSGNNNPPPVNKTTTITGRVVDRNGNPPDSPVVGATFRLRLPSGDQTATTDASGRFTLTITGDVPAGQAFVTGPNNSAGQPLFYNTGYYNNTLYALGTAGFATPAVPAGTTKDLGTIVLYDKDAPPPPPAI